MIKLGIGLLPDNLIKQNLFGMSEVLNNNFEISYRLDDINHIPHLTIYQAKFGSFDNIKITIQKLLNRKAVSPKIALDNIGLWAESFVLYDCKKTNDIQDLHEKVFNQLKLLVTKDTFPIGKEQNLRGLSKEEIKNIEKYGYPFVEEQFRPHFTLGRVVSQDLNIENIKNILKGYTERLKNYNFKSTQMIIYECGIDGSCIKILEKFNLNE